MKNVLISILVFIVMSVAVAQSDNPVSVRLEIFVVSMVDGEETFTESTTARPGQVVEYRLYAVNNGDTTLPPSSVTVTGPVPEGTAYVEASATPSSDTVIAEFSINGSDFVADETEATADGGSIQAVRWTLDTDMEPAQEDSFVYRVTVSRED